MIFEANDVKKSKQAAVFLSIVWPKTCKFLCDLMSLMLQKDKSVTKSLLFSRNTSNLNLLSSLSDFIFSNYNKARAYQLLHL